MKHRLIPIMLAVVALGNSLALARLDEEEKPKGDARYMDYAQDVLLKGTGTSLLWLLLIGLIVVTIAVLFKKATRTHLD